MEKLPTNKLFFQGLVIVFSLIIMGGINLYSALYDQRGLSLLFYKHLIFLTIGLLAAFFIQILNTSYLENSAYFFYAFLILLLILVLIFGKKVNGAKRWLGFGSLTFQPSEFVKLAIIFVLARYFHFMPVSESGYRLSHLVIPLSLVFLPVLLIMKQPDLGTAIIVLSIAFSMFLILGINKKLLLSSFVGGVIFSPILWFFLKEYQRKRLIAFLAPERDPLGTGYHTIQSTIAVGTGGFTGKGYLKGIQSKLGFIPEKHTDFIFSVFAEEWGFFGVLCYMFLSILLILWMFKVIKNVKDRFIFLTGSGIIALFSLQIIINVAMVTGLFPVVGVPLPLFSYGGTALIVNLAAIGFMLKISRM